MNNAKFDIEDFDETKQDIADALETAGFVPVSETMKAGFVTAAKNVPSKNQNLNHHYSNKSACVPVRLK
jgi:hypothetical protein